MFTGSKQQQQQKDNNMKIKKTPYRDNIFTVIEIIKEQEL